MSGRVSTLRPIEILVRLQDVVRCIGTERQVSRQAERHRSDEHDDHATVYRLREGFHFHGYMTGNVTNLSIEYISIVFNRRGFHIASNCIYTWKI